MKLLLLSTAIKKGNLDYPLPTASLKATLDKRFSPDQLQTRLMISSLEDSPSDIIHRILAEEPQVVGLSVYLWNRQWMNQLADGLKEQAPGIVLIAGGAEASALPRELMKEMPLDYLIRGEGEGILSKLMQSLLKNQHPEKTAGLMDKKDLEAPAMAPVLDWEEMPSPLLEGTLDLQEQNHLLWELTRGCPYRCAFCFESRGSRLVRPVPEERFLAEAALICQSPVEEVFVLDPTFNHDKKRCKKILRHLIQLEPECHFTFEIRMEGLDRTMIELFSSLSCALQVGLQSSSPEICRKMNRHLDRDLFKERAQWLMEYQVPFGLDLIYGLPGDSLEGFRKSLDFALEMQPSNLEIFPLMLLPGTELYEKAPAWGIKQGNASFEGWEHPDFPAEDMRQAASLAGAIEEFYAWGLAADWFIRLCLSLECRPVELIEEFALFRLKETSGPEGFLAMKLGGEQKYQPIWNLIRLYRGLDLIYKEEEGPGVCLTAGAVLLELDYAPEELQELFSLSDNEFLSCFPMQPYYWVFYASEEGAAWESLQPEAWQILQKLEEGKAAEDIRREFPGFPLEDFIGYGIETGFIGRDFTL